MNDVTSTGEFLTRNGERYYKINRADKMAPFFVSVVSNADHWLFASSNGGLTAGRVSPENALFPYVPVDKIHDSAPHTGPKTIVRVTSANAVDIWEPFNREHDDKFLVERNLYKNIAGNKLCYEEINHDLALAYRYTWMFSNQFGFVRQCELQQLGDGTVRVEILDGMQNVLPAGTPAITQNNASNLVDAYKWAELDEGTGLGIFTLYSGISDRAEPAESLRANTVFCLGLDVKETLISTLQLDRFRSGHRINNESRKRGIRGAYFVRAEFDLAPNDFHHWQFVANIERDQGQVIELLHMLGDPYGVAQSIERSIDRGTDDLTRVMASADGFQATNEENVVTHHYANVLFNVLRGGIFDDQYNVSAADFRRSVKHFNKRVYERNKAFLHSLPERIDAAELHAGVNDLSDKQLERLCLDYLPVTFGRRHGDPSRPWNHFSISLKDASGNRLLSYEGNWRDIFQNWEALAFSYPDFTENIIARFVNASTMDGYNPYRINKQGIDWEVEERDDPWSYIGYWGDHQIIYLQKLLELSERFHPNRLKKLLRSPLFSYANVPYRIKPFAELLENPKSTVKFDYKLAASIDQRVAELGADGKLTLDTNGDVYQVTLIEKLLVPLLAKLGNFVIDGGIWLNTQRPEWNDANNALVGHGLSLVTLYYMRRYVRLLQRLLADENADVEISVDVARWVKSTATALRNIDSELGSSPVSASQRFEALRELGEAASNYREKIYRTEHFSARENQSLDQIRSLLDDSLLAIEHSIASNRRDDGLYNAYRLLKIGDDEATSDALYPMLEGQVAALSSGAIAPDAACDMLDALFESGMYRADQHSFMLYPDRDLPGFLQRNIVPEEDVMAIPLLQRMLDANDTRIIYRDPDGNCRFNSDFSNVDELNCQLEALVEEYGDEIAAAREALQKLYETVFNHRAFTGRSGGMFGFEGLGCIYWHMVAKLLLAVQENFFAAESRGADSETRARLGRLYYNVRAGIGFNKTPTEFGAFPNDPYSHSPSHAGARQPGMTGQVKEEILTRWGELGIRVRDGSVNFDPKLLRAREFSEQSASFRFLDLQGDWREIDVPSNALAFTWCQTPVVYVLDDNSGLKLLVELSDGNYVEANDAMLSADQSRELFSRSGHIRRITLTLNSSQLFNE